MVKLLSQRIGPVDLPSNGQLIARLISLCEELFSEGVNSVALEQIRELTTASAMRDGDDAGGTILAALKHHFL
jgi:hypothetical protein